MSYYPYPKRDTSQNFFLLPNEIHRLGLSAGAIAVYGYLRSIENRETYDDEHSVGGHGDPGGTTANAPWALCAEGEKDTWCDNAG